MRVPRRLASGFSLVELLVVMAIILILAGMVITYAWQARLKAVQASCLSNIRQRDKLTCPLGAAYAHTRYATSESQVSDLTGTVMIFESHNETDGTEVDVWPLHFGGSNYVFWDGHAKWSKTIPNFRP